MRLWVIAFARDSTITRYLINILSLTSYVWHARLSQNQCGRLGWNGVDWSTREERSQIMLRDCGRTYGTFSNKREQVSSRNGHICTHTAAMMNSGSPIGSVCLGQFCLRLR